MGIIPSASDITRQLRSMRSAIALILTAAAIFAVFFSSPIFIRPTYKATLVAYPASTTRISGAIMGDELWPEKDLLEFGEKENANQMIQILKSNVLRDKIINRFSLAAHYSIDSSKTNAVPELHRRYQKNIRLKRTEFNAVEISVYDTDPQLAADIANNMAEMLDTLINSMQKERALMGYAIANAVYEEKAAYIAQLEDSLSRIMGHGVHDYESQSQVIHEQLAVETARNNTAGIKALDKKLELLAEYGGPYLSIKEELEYEKERLSELKLKLNKAKIDASEILPQKFIVSSAYKAERKSYPVRWAIIAGLTLSTLVMMVLTVFIMMVIGNLRGRDYRNSMELS